MPKTLNIFILFLVLFLSVSSPVKSQEVYKINPKYPVHDLGSALRIYTDTEHNYTKENILNDQIGGYISGSEEPRYLELGPTYWGKLKIETSKKLEGWTLQFRDNRVGPPAWTKSNGKVDVFGFVNGKQIFHKKTGVEYPNSERDVDANWVLNQVSMDDIPVNEQVTIVIKARGNQIGYSPYFHLSARSPDYQFYHQIYQFQNSFNLFMFGITFIIFLYHVLQYIYLKERVYLWFSIWLAFCTLTMAMSVGILIGSFTSFRFEIWMLIANGIFYSFWFFGRSFIQSKRKFPKLDFAMKSLALILLIEIIITAAYVAVTEAQTNQTGIGIHYLVLNIYTIASFILSIILITKKDLFARYFGVGSLIASSFLIIGLLWSLGIIKPIRFFDPYATAMFFQIIVYSFGLTYRRQVINKQVEAEKLLAEKNYAEMIRVKELDEIKTKFFANISHEFRTPLALISGPLSMAKNESIAENDDIVISPKSYDVILKNTHRLENLIDQLLELSKLEGGNVNLKLTQGGIIKFIKSIVFSFESMSERENISLNTSFPEEIDNAFYDRDKLEKILTNLISNAFKYTPNGGTVTLTVENENNHIKLEITDTGKGIAKDDIKQIFQRFYRAEGTEEKGSGIGLALTKEMVDLHNGHINVTSKKGEGTTFKVGLPYALKDLPENILLSNSDSYVHLSETSVDDILQSEDLELSEKLENSTSENRQMVLVVEDNADLRDFICDILKSKFQVLKAEDGLKGERMAFEHIPDLIITDIMMPKKDGFQLCSSLKSNAKTSHIPIIMLTAVAGQQNKMEGLTQGADAYLTKPFKNDELVLRVSNLIESRQKMWDYFKSLDLGLISDLEVESIDDKFLQNVVTTIKDNLDNEDFSVSDLGKQVGFSRAQLHRKLKALSNKSANQLIVEMRLNEAKYKLENKAGSISEIAYSVGYSNMSYFTKSFKEKFGILPSRVLDEK